MGSIVERQGHRDVLRRRDLLEQHRALADNAELLDCREPVGAVGDGRRRASEDRHTSFVGQCRTGHEIDEQLRRGLIEPRKPDVFAGLDAELPQAQRPQAAVGLDDAVEG